MASRHRPPAPTPPGFIPGFTLIELLVVLAIIAVGSAIAAANFSAGTGSAGLKAAARDVVSTLLYAKGQAAIERRQVTVDFDLATNSYRVSGRDKVYSVPDDIALAIVTAEDEVTGQGQASIRFYPDGSATGGRVTLRGGNRKWQIDINWLTGVVELNER